MIDISAQSAYFGALLQEDRGKFKDSDEFEDVEF